MTLLEQGFEGLPGNGGKPHQARISLSFPRDLSRFFLPDVFRQFSILTSLLTGGSEVHAKHQCWGATPDSAGGPVHYMFEESFPDVPLS